MGDLYHPTQGSMFIVRKSGLWEVCVHVSACVQEHAECVKAKESNTVETENWLCSTAKLLNYQTQNSCDYLLKAGPSIPWRGSQGSYLPNNLYN